MSRIERVIVVAAARNSVIGRAGGMPWRLPSDLKHFKALTLGKPVVMGRRTFLSIGRALPGRANIVVTRDAAFTAEGVETAGSLDEALALADARARETDGREVCIIGGGEIYRLALPLADIDHLTVVEAEIDGDTVFPPLDPLMFEKVADRAVAPSETDSHRVRFTTWARKGAPERREGGNWHAF